MSSDQHKFLEAVLGVNGAAIMTRLADSSDMIKATLVPRSIVAWLGAVGDYNNLLPGSEIHLSLTKTESGYTGEFDSVEIKNATIERTAAVIAVGLGAEVGISKFRDVDLAKFGKTVDLLVKAQMGAAGGMGGGLAQGHHPSKAGGMPSVGKDVTVPPIKPDKPDMADTTALKNPSNKAPKMALSEEEAEKVCKVCKGKQKDDKGNIKGCHCVRDLSGSLEVKKTESGYELSFGVGWDEAAISILMNRVGK